MIKIRPATAGDASALLEIYRPYVEETAVSFEITLPSAEEFRSRIVNISRHYPYLVAESPEGKIIGYAYANHLSEREAYSRSVETTIYLEKSSRHSGTGSALYQKLLEELAAQGILNMYACITVPDPDKYVTDDSIGFHHAMGYRKVARFHRCGFKFGRWFDVVWMEKFIGRHLDTRNHDKVSQ